MNLADFDYDLPESQIAQTPVEPRDASRLLVLHRQTGEAEHSVFREIGRYLHPGDLLVLNQTRVIPVRLYARKPTGGRVELLLLRRRDDLTWEALVGGKGLRAGSKLTVENGPQAEIVALLDGAERLVHFAEPIEPYLPRLGHVPLPPYIHQQLTDPERYQTVYARVPGSAAAPTAGLHFTPRLLDELQSQGIRLAYVTLHIGLDTFVPVTEPDPRQHKMHSEWCELPEETALAVNETRCAGRRVIAVGTTSVRTLESAAVASNLPPLPPFAAPSPQDLPCFSAAPSSPQAEGLLPPFRGDTSLYILPGYRFRVVDALITNFHLPRSTLIMLVSAFAGRQRILETYRLAIREGYRFYSFGDAMLIL